MHTEDEAKQKWCPLSMAGETYEKCAASQCMAWRWGINGHGEYLYEDLRAHPRKRVGYCGLAGKGE